MFRRHTDAVFLDLSVDLRDRDDWKIGPLRTIDYPQNITAFATEPISRLLAIGTAGGAIHLFGGPGVETRLITPDTVGIKFLQFASSSFQLVCLDETNVLHTWDLTVIGQPKLVTSARFDATNNGEIRTYDLVCLRKSSYNMPNMWKLHQERLKASRTEHATLRAYELVLPPGAPGGFGYGGHDLLTHRRPEVTALTIHPAGHFFAVGYADGSLAFWAVDDEDKPLLVRTLDELDVNLVDQGRLDEQIYRQNEDKSTSALDREPIFKLSWSGFPNSSDPRGGKTTLAILGGLNSGDAPGLTIIQFPPFNPLEPPASTSPNPGQPALHPVIRQAMRDSLNVLDSYFYFTEGVIQDYLLIPRNSPHFAGTFDPIAILLLTEEGTTRTVEAFQYPPPAFSDPSESPAPGATAIADPLSSLADDLAHTLKDLEENKYPRRLVIPAALLHGKSGILGGQLLKLERETYQTLAAGKVEDCLALPLNGGQAWADEFRTNDLKLAKFQPHRILVTWHRDLTVCFEDLSAQLLTAQRPAPLQTDFPNMFFDLTLDLRPVLLDPFVDTRTSPTLMEHTRISSVYFATEALETIVVLTTGEVIQYQLSGPRKPMTHRDARDKELIILGHIPSHRGFSPHLMLSPELGPAEACAVSDIEAVSRKIRCSPYMLGFLAVAYSNALFIVNMRAPEILLRRSENKSVRNKHVTGFIPSHSDSDRVTSMIWCTSQLAKDSEPQVRLVVIKVSGHYQIYTLFQSGSSAKPWSCEGPITVDGGVQYALPRGNFVIDSKTGARLPANHVHLARAGSGKPKVSSILVMVGAKGARCFANINGERVGKTEWGHKVGEVLEAQIVEKLGSRILMVMTSRQDALVYSLPRLEHIMTLKIPVLPSSSLSVDESGDFVAWNPHPTSGTMDQATYGTFFDIRRTYEMPDIDLACTKPVVPPAPQPVSLGPASMFQQVGSWLPFKQSVSGAQLDELLAVHSDQEMDTVGGPNRPIPKPEQSPSRNFYSAADISAGASEVAAAAMATQANLYNRITSALSERGQALNDLEERFNALGEESKNMAGQAKRLATQYTAKSWFGL
ncbi:hypothetical protein C0995_001571 [Termitomyces sp. Mi166|nr:hypothetical protein C0995_001571 [Termitomyces sp. Mi166\